jgi:thioredoxin-like negative regulator of GroEL
LKHFWQGFADKEASQISFKKHVIMLFWEPDSSSSVIKEIKKLSFRYPTVKVKIINASKEPTKPLRLGVRDFPTVLLLKDGREVDRVSRTSPMLLEQLFRKATV